MAAHDFQIVGAPTNAELEQGYTLLAEAVGVLKQQVAKLVAQSAKQQSQINALLAGNAQHTQMIDALQKASHAEH